MRAFLLQFCKYIIFQAILLNNAHDPHLGLFEETYNLKNANIFRKFALIMCFLIKPNAPSKKIEKKNLGINGLMIGKCETKLIPRCELLVKNCNSRKVVESYIMNVSFRPVESIFMNTFSAVTVFTTHFSQLVDRHSFSQS